MLATTTGELLHPSALPSAAVCLHCGDACGTNGIVSAAGTFCCGGCESVFQIIHSHGLAAFYACDVRPGLSQKDAERRDRGQFAALDSPEVSRRFIDFEHDGIAHARFAVPALHCASCLWLVEQLWRFDPGICRSEADLLRRTVRVSFNPSRTSLRAVAERLASLGYEPVIDAERAPGRMPTARRDLYLKIGVAGFAFGNVMLFSIPRYANGAPLEPTFQHVFDALNILFAIPVLLYSASPYFSTAWAALRAKTMALEVPVALGLAVLFVRSVADIWMGWGEGFLDSFSGLVFFLLIGRLFQQKAFDGIAFDRTVRSFFPLSVRVERAGDTRLVPIDELRAGDVVLIRPFEIVPADAVLLDERGALDYAFVSGESTPTPVSRGDAISAGGRVVGRALRLAVLREVSHSRLAELWNHPVFASAKTPWLGQLSGRFGWWFTVAALALAAAGALAWWPDAATSVSVATAVLIIACPCALTLAAPITLGTAMGILGRAGLFLKHPAVALDLSRIDTITFDKTGTLTSADLEAQDPRHDFSDRDWQVIRRLAAESVHPLSRAIVGSAPVSGTLTEFREASGQGVAGIVDGRHVAIGRADFVARSASHPLTLSPSHPLTLSPSHPLIVSTYASVDGAEPRGIQIGQPDRPGMREAVDALARRHEVWVLSGDRLREAAPWSRWFGDRARFGLSPEEKLAEVQAHQARGRRVLMVGDGLNDSGALATADVGLAVSDQTACLVPACDAVIRGDRLARLPVFLSYARRARRVVVLCFAVSVIYNAVGLAFALAGRLTPLTTAILMPVSSLTVVGLSVGLMRRGAAALVTPCK